MKKSILLSLIGFSGLVMAQIPTGHYDGTDNLSGTALKTKLSQIEASGHKDLGYNWAVFATADRDNYYEKDNSVLDIYSENPKGADPYNFTIVTNQCGNYNGEGVCYNREHTIPKSTFGDARPMHNDYHHLLATDGYVNGKRSNWPYGEVGTASWTSKNGSKLGNSKLNGYGGTVFEPIDEFKGDIARIYFYFATRYENQIQSFNYDMYDGTKTTVFAEPFRSMLVKWHQQDPVSQKEIDRNNAVAKLQGNRNAYVDHPEFVAKIWGTVLAVDDASFSKNLTIAPNPVKGNVIAVTGDKDLKQFKKAMIYNMVGQNVQTIENPFQNGNTITLNNLPKGIYILKTGELNTKFIVD
ncbi:endonuclease [Epilithonimonas lactis]|uniref:Endonuclease I n=1 Tax=Epilithonimonas lactis TaxID=421072 RepID=A0A085B644_9FLAO|nr:endonuclease [Epilithonimonas lactis]KFC17939.1 endonuclease I [Epilithonimonas lactis]SEP91277.1 Por secretion system C-terminal sorting domain-containing protein [Epilithonimonas lactis]